MKRTASSLTFIVPDLLDPVPYLDQLPVQDLPELPIFNKILSRGNFFTPKSLNSSPDKFYNCLLNEISTKGSFENADLQMPVASLSYLFDLERFNKKNSSDSEQANTVEEPLNDSLKNSLKHSLKERWIMRADPSFMVPDRDQLLLAQTGSLDISREEAEMLTGEINLFFENFEEENFWTLKAVSPDRWYIISDKPINIYSVPPENVLGQSVKSFLFSNKKFSNKKLSNKKLENEPLNETEDGRHWLNLFNEFQMILHQSEVNKKRIHEKRVPINSLWLWGAGKTIDSSVLDVFNESDLTIYSNNPFAQNFCRSDRLESSGLSDDILSTLYKTPLEPSPLEPSSLNESAQQIMYIIDDFSQAIRNKDIFSWVGLLEQFEENYLVPLVNDLKSGKIEQIEFISPSGRKFLINKKLLNRWWKRNIKYYSFLSASEHI